MEQILMSILRFLKRNKKLFVGLTLTGAYALLQQKYGFRFPGGFQFGNNVENIMIDPGVINPPQNSAESSIMAIYKSARGMDFDSQKLTAAEQICKIAMQPGATDATKAYAIDILSNLPTVLDFDSSKRRLNSMIVQLSMQKGEAQ